MSRAAVLDMEVIDRLRQLTMPGEPDVLNDIFAVFLQDVPQRIERLRNAYTAGNIQDMRRAAHSLKGSAGNIGARAMFDVCRQVDELNEVTPAGPLVDALAVEFENVKREIHRLTGVKE
jgi:HPt (histidine-containing phosphotransfer) domain-containing protein